jgi:hypothetical protein
MTQPTFAQPCRSAVETEERDRKDQDLSGRLPPACVGPRLPTGRFQCPEVRGSVRTGRGKELEWGLEDCWKERWKLILPASRRS